jgi:hypothetical protein
MATNLSQAPYYDDFSVDADYHQVLFKPGVSVQARELTQSQSILRNQIAQFGGHVFKHGSVVMPGNSTTDFDVGYVKIQTTLVDVTSLVGQTLTGNITGLRVYVKFAVQPTATDPATLFVTYYNTGLAGERVFAPAETLTNNIENILTFGVDPCGASVLASVSRGTFFVNGTFANVSPQTIVIEKYTGVPSCHVLLKITESIVDANTDTTLLDPAQGSYNYAAPGADRLKISLTLMTLPLNSDFGDDYIELMRYDEGVLLEHLRYSKYSELEKNLARRTFDESGDYVVTGLGNTAREHLKRAVNGGKYDLAAGGDASKFILTTGAGKAYVNGYETEIFSYKETVIDKARTLGHIKTTAANLVPSYGQYIKVTDVNTLPNFLQQETISFYSATSGGVLVGTANALAIDFLEFAGATETSSIYDLYITNVQFSAGKSVADIGRVTFTTGAMNVVHEIVASANTATDFVLDEIITVASSPTRLATVRKFTRSTGELYVLKHSASNAVPVSGDNITAPSTANARVLSVDVISKNITDNLLVELPKKSVKSVSGISGLDMSYKVYYYTTVTCVGGNASFSVSGMAIDPKEQGNFIIAASDGTVKPISVATVAPDGLSVTITGITPLTATLYIVCAATKTMTGTSPKTKTKTTAAPEVVTLSSGVGQLKYADGIRLVSVISSTEGNVTSRFTFDNGQRDYVYDRSSIILTSGSAPTGTITVIYDYFIHNAGSGDHFSVDSYVSSGLTDYFESSLLFYTSRSEGRKYDLRNCLDFRPRKGITGVLSGTSSLTNYLVQNDSRITSSVQSYVGRYDVAVLDKSSNVRIIPGVPQDNPVVPVIPSETISLCSLYVPPYTYSINDIRITKSDNKVYTMKDVSKIENRLEQLEEYVTLTESEASAVNYDIVDAQTGLSRFKSGYLVDTFQNPDTISDILNDQFTVTYFSGNIIPQFEVIETPLIPLTSNNSNCQVTNGVVSLPYTETVFAKQPFSSRITNINPFSVFSWHGQMTITPKSDSWEEIQNLPSVLNVNNRVVNNTVVNVVTETVDVKRPWNWVPPFWAQVSFAPAPIPVVSSGAASAAAGSSGSSAGCFTADTLVTMYDGSFKEISKIRSGDLVMNKDRTSYNVVLYVESLKNIMWGMYSPDPEYPPFATMNHPIYFGGELVLPTREVQYYWLGDVKYIPPIWTKPLSESEEMVYNLWLDGDSTYIVNGYGTTSILEDTRFLRNVIKYDHSTHDQCMQMLCDAAANNELINGSYAVSKVLGALDSRILDRIVSSIFNDGKITKTILLAFLKTVGSIVLKKSK